MVNRNTLVSGFALLSGVASAATPVNQTTCNGRTYSYNSLAGYGALAGDDRDKFGDTLGGIGSSIAIDQASWVKHADSSYSGLLYALPDRGWNTQGTLNYQGRFHKFLLSFRPAPNATVANPSAPNIHVTYLDTVLLTDPLGKPTTGIDGSPHGQLNYPGFPALPVANFSGDGFGGPGPGGRLVPVDNEGLVLAKDGSLWISDEYGPYVYHYTPDGHMVEAIRPPDAIVPMRNGSDSFSADSPPVYAHQTDDVMPADPDSGRENNHGFECLTSSPDGNNLYVMLQEAAVQEGGTKSSTERYVRLLHYDISRHPANFVAEFVVPLPLYSKGSKPNTAGASEMHYVSDTQFLVLSRDSGAGRGQTNTQSVYRHADVIDISGATNIKGSTFDCSNCSVAPKGVLNSAIKPAQYCTFLDYNVNSQLNRFGVHNGGAQDATLLNEKWESLALVPSNPGTSDGNYILFSFSDDDFITQKGYMNFGRYPYSDASGYNLDNQMLAFNVQLPS